MAGEETLIPAGSIPVTVMIFTLNEELNLPDSLAATAWAAERIVIDSGSTDRTIAIAEAAAGAGVRLIHQPFGGSFAAHRNTALDSIETTHPWLLMLDADERPDATMVRAIAAITARPMPGDEAAGAAVGYEVVRRQWTTDGPGTPFRPRRGGRKADYPIRFFLNARGRFEDRKVHEYLILNGPKDRLAGYLDHRDAKDWQRFFQRHLHYAVLEADEITRFLKGAADGQIKSSVWQAGAARNRALKLFAYRYLPFRPLWVFLWFFCVKGGFLDGRVGFEDCIARAVYEFQISVLLRERLARQAESDTQTHADESHRS